jgi:hypothetical protein
MERKEFVWDFGVKVRRKEQLGGRADREWEENLKRDLSDKGQGATDSIDLAHEEHQWRALVNTGMNITVALMLASS